MNIFRFSLLSAGLMLVAFGQFACGKAEKGGSSEQKGMQSQATVQTQPGERISRAKAEQIALGKFPDSYLTGTELEAEMGKWFYSVGVRNPKGAYKVSIDAYTGEVVETDDKTAKFQAKVAEGRAVDKPISAADIETAEKVALTVCPGEFREWKAKPDSERVALHFTILDSSGVFKKVVVAAGTNEILRMQ